jgi:phosphomannomutase
MSKVIKTKTTAKKVKKVEPVVEPELNLLYKIKLQNMTAHANSLNIISIQNDELKQSIKNIESLITEKKTEREQNIKLPSEITNHLNNKPWIRIPYPIREMKLVEYTKDMSQEIKDKMLKLLYEKKLTSKVVVYNQTNGIIENITIELE